jgi:ABC-type molybdate transport system ATPase subunit
MDIKQFEKDMSVFSFRQHQDVVTYLERLEITGWTSTDARAWVKEKQEEIKQRLKGQKLNIRNLRVIFKCPECKALMQLLPVNVTKATLTGDNSRSMWLCSNKACMNTVYNKESIEELRSKGGT